MKGSLEGTKRGKQKIINFPKEKSVEKVLTCPVCRNQHFVIVKDISYICVGCRGVFLLPKQKPIEFKK